MRTTLQNVRATRGHLIVRDFGSNWGLDAPNLEVVAVKGDDYRGTMTWRGGTLLIQQYEPMWAHFTAAFRVADGKVVMERMSLDADGAQVEGDRRHRPGPVPQRHLHPDLASRAAAHARHLLRQGPVPAARRRRFCRHGADVQRRLRGAGRFRQPRGRLRRLSLPGLPRRRRVGADASRREPRHRPLLRRHDRVQLRARPARPARAPRRRPLGRALPRRRPGRPHQLPADARPARRRARHRPSSHCVDARPGRLCPRARRGLAAGGHARRTRVPPRPRCPRRRSTAPAGGPRSRARSARTSPLRRCRWPPRSPTTSTATRCDSRRASWPRPRPTWPSTAAPTGARPRGCRST